ncbi:MAG: mannose-1-phosphate guanylyltransferase, partial [Patescibacteria group bacterium]
YDLGKKNGQGNVIISDSNKNVNINIDTQDSLIHANNRLVATIGLQNMIIVDTKEILLIAPKKRSQEVKKLVEKLKKEKRKEYL